MVVGRPPPPHGQGGKARPGPKPNLLRLLEGVAVQHVGLAGGQPQELAIVTPVHARLQPMSRGHELLPAQNVVQIMQVLKCSTIQSSTSAAST